MNFHHVLALTLIWSSVDATFPTTADIMSILGSLERIVGFYSLSADQANLDGLYGLRVIEGMLQDISASFVYKLLDDPLKHRISDILQKCENPIRDGVAAVKRNEAEAYEALKPLVDERYTVKRIPRTTKPELRWPFTLNLDDSFDVFDEEKSDKCFGILFSASKTRSCLIPSECVKLITTPNVQSYPLTHQILFSIEADKGDVCADVWESKLNNAGYLSNMEFQRIWCTNSYYETLRYVHIRRNRNGERVSYVKPQHLDIFLEHLFVCPSIGFYEFLKEEYLSIIFNAQHSTGCFKIDESVLKQGKRKLLKEHEAEDGCMFHLTAVASGALSSYLRFTLALRYESEKLDLDLQNDNKHYLEAVEEGKLRPTHTVQSNQTFYLIFMAINMIFFVLLYSKARLISLKRLVRRLLPL